MAKVFIDEALPRQVPAAEHTGEIWLTLGPYRARLAADDADRSAAYRLRFLVFNLELKEGLEAAYQSGQDRDEFDAFCDHLIVEDTRTRQVVGTYRLQSGAAAAQNIGYYSAQLFDFSPYKSLRDSVLELGRAAVHRNHRSLEVLTLLWRAIAQYALHRNLRYLIGCSSLTSQDPREGSAMYQRLQTFLVEPPFRTRPTAEYALPLVANPGPAPKAPKLLRAYLSLGAGICGPPALDREFRTIDFLTLLDLQGLSPVVRARFLR